MALPWALAVLSLLRLLSAQDPACANLKTVPITNATLEWLSGKWFYIASVFRNPEYKETAREIQAEFFYFTPDLAKDVVFLREYPTIRGQCGYTSSNLRVHRAEGTVSGYEEGTERIAHLLLTKDPRTYMFSSYPDDELNRGLSFYADKQEVTRKQLQEFYDALKCMGLQDTEIFYTDGQKDRCGPLERQHEEERKKEKKGSQEDTELI